MPIISVRDIGNNRWKKKAKKTKQKKQKKKQKKNKGAGEKQRLRAKWFFTM